MSPANPQAPLTPIAEQSDIHTFIPEEKKLVVDGVNLEILPVKVGKISATATAIQPIWHLINGDVKLNFLELLMLYTDPVLNLLEVLTAQPREWVDNLNAEDTVKLLTLYFEVNSDFLLQRVFPLLPALREKIAALSLRAAAQVKEAAGQTNSKV